EPHAIFTASARIPPAGQAAAGTTGRARIVRHVVEEHQARARRTLELEDVETAGMLIEPVAVTSGGEAEEVRDQETDGRLVRHDQHVPARMLADDGVEHRQRARHDADARLPALRCAGERVLLPRRVLLGEAFLDLAAAEPLPVAVIDLA